MWLRMREIAGKKKGLQNMLRNCRQIDLSTDCRFVTLWDGGGGLALNTQLDENRLFLKGGNRLS